MKMTLTVDVSDTFRKGNCALCPLKRIDSFGNMYCAFINKVGSSEECPLDFEKEKDLFGRYCKVPTEWAEDTFKVISNTKSNFWVDVPLKDGVSPKMHDTTEDVISIVPTGQFASRIFRVALKDVELI